MIKIYKVSHGSAIDFAAEELKKYLRMMMPESNTIDIEFDTSANNGFRLGLFSDLGINETVEDEKLDDALFADCDEFGGIISGVNPRSVLLAVYEYLRRNGLRWLYPGVDGEYIPIKDIEPVSFMIKPSCRYRGYANTSAASILQNLDLIDFLPKVGMNTFMVEFRVPVYYTTDYYNHKRNEKNRPAEKLTNEGILQWKRATECEAEKRGLVFHDVGHGFCIDPFGIDSCYSWNITDESVIPEESRQYLAKIGGKRGLFGGVPVNTQFCMSNPEARMRVAKYVANYAKMHSNVDILHVWLADGFNNHCECEECIKSTPSDLYVELLNDIDGVMTEEGIETKIVFLAYVDTSSAPEYARINNQDRFIFMLAPFTRLYYDSIPKDGLRAENPPYKRNDITLAGTLEEYLVYYNDWKKMFRGSSFAFEYHFCWNEMFDLSTFKFSKLINDEVRLYKSMGIDGMVEDGDIRPFFPNGLQFYTHARSQFDTSLTAEEIAEDYLFHAYGKDYKKFREFFESVERVLPYAYFAKKMSENPNVSLFYNPELADKIDKELPEVLKIGQALVFEHYDNDIRVHTVSVRLLGHFIDFLSGYGKIISKKARALDDEAKALYEDFKNEFGKRECEIERYFNHTLWFNYLSWIVFDNSSKQEFVV